eukprot:TRINITY_DN100912_c0_g1_i1.p1 TRINITY_DN100912_c0_g1~~TRINITY_DN100912_c0_g1_i1.p1  ORF type:complete len:552 (-),score=26.08 TRINITY_DN100912_c0_g1_i1:194-1849(-)
MLCACSLLSLRHLILILCLSVHGAEVGESCDANSPSLLNYRSRLKEFHSKRIEAFPPHHFPFDPPFDATGCGMQPATVYVGFALVRLEGLDILTRTLSLFVWFRMFWYDPRLAYNGTDLRTDWDSNGMWLQLDPRGIWTPDLADINSVEFKPSAYGDVSAFVYDEHYASKEGYNVFYSRPGVLSTKCEVDLSWFPFDSHLCSLRVEPWAQGPRDITLQAISGKKAWETQMQLNNEEYKIESVKIKDPERTVYASIGSWPRLEVVLTLQRHPNYFVATAILPQALLSLLASFTFFLPAGNRVQFASTMLLVIFASLISFAGKRPPLRQMTWLEDFIAVTVVWSLLCIFFVILHDKWGNYVKGSSTPPSKDLTPPAMKRQDSDSLLIIQVASASASGASLSSWRALLPKRWFVDMLDAVIRVFLPSSVSVAMVHYWARLKSEREVDILDFAQDSMGVRLMVYSVIALVMVNMALVFLTTLSVVTLLYNWITAREASIPRASVPEETTASCQSQTALHAAVISVAEASGQEEAEVQPSGQEQVKVQQEEPVHAI